MTGQCAALPASPAAPRRPGPAGGQRGSGPGLMRAPPIAELPPGAGAAPPPGVATHIADTLEEAILSGRLAPGTALLQLDLAAHFGVSRVPVRDALAILEQRQLAVRVPRRGVMVRPITPEGVRAVFAARRLLEAAVTRLAAERLTPADLAELERVLVAQRAGGARGRPGRRPGRRPGLPRRAVAGLRQRGAAGPGRLRLAPGVAGPQRRPARSGVDRPIGGPPRADPGGPPAGGDRAGRCTRRWTPCSPPRRRPWASWERKRRRRAMTRRAERSSFVTRRGALTALGSGGATAGALLALGACAGGGQGAAGGSGTPVRCGGDPDLLEPLHRRAASSRPSRSRVCPSSRSAPLPCGWSGGR